MQSVILLSLLIILSPTCHSIHAQGIKGKVIWMSGNQMPGPGRKQNNVGTGIKREIYIYKPTTPAQTIKADNPKFYKQINSELVAKTMSKKDGSFKIKLPPGEYSVFVKEPGRYFANLFDSKGRINVVKVEPGSYTTILLSVDYTATY